MAVLVHLAVDQNLAVLQGQKADLSVAAMAVEKGLRQTKVLMVVEEELSQKLKVLNQRRAAIMPFLASREVINLKMLSISQKALLVDKIDELLVQLKQDIRDLEEDTQPIAPENAIGRVSRMDAINTKSVAEESLRHAKARQIALLEAKENITHPDFGTCFSCKEAIPFERLLFRPESRRCTQCAR